VYKDKYKNDKNQINNVLNDSTFAGGKSCVAI